MPFAEELRLLLAIFLTAAVFASAYAVARRLGAGGRLQAACDGLLLGYVVQYLSVALPGSVGLLNLWTMSAVALFASALCWIVAGLHRSKGGGAFVDQGGQASRTVLLLRAIGRPDRLGFLASAIFVAAYAGAYGFVRRWFPVMSTDPLVYHLPAAVQWLQTGRLGLFDTWYWNPAATYSPATTSTFIYWLLAPMRNDVLARYVQFVPLLMIFLIVARLSRILGSGLTVAGLVAAAAALGRPLFSQVLDPKDDLIITAFFASAVLSLSGRNPRDRLGPWRAGLAFGMVLASKYTILMMCPLFLFMVDAPLRAIRSARSGDLQGDELRAATPRPLLKWSLAALIALTLSMPWYLRTWAVTGNPLFPVDVKVFGHRIFTGLFTTEHDQELRSAGGVWKMLAETYHSFTIVPLVVLLLFYAAAIAAAGRAAWRDPLRRACLIGAPITLVIFLLASPHHEVRYIFPLLPLVFAAGSLAIKRWLPWRAAEVGAGLIFAGVSLATSFAWNAFDGILALTAYAAPIAVLIIALAFGLSLLARRAPSAVPRILLALGGVTTLLAAMELYVDWAAYIGAYREGSEWIWKTNWSDQADAWHYVRAETPGDATIAFANTAYVYPLYGFDLTRHIVYAPVRPGVTKFTDLPRLGETVPGDLILDAMTATQNANADRATWLFNLRRLGADFVVIYKDDRSKDPPEQRFAAELPDTLHRVFDDLHAVIYRVEK